jgi:hypothetical protein
MNEDSIEDDYFAGGDGTKDETRRGASIISRHPFRNSSIAGSFEERSKGSLSRNLSAMEENMPDKPNVGTEKGIARSRRAFVKEAAAAAVLTGAVPSSAALDGKSWLAEANAEAMDEALKRMTGLAQLTNHGPMAAEALVTRYIPYLAAG